MSSTLPTDWNPVSNAVQSDQIAVYDDMPYCKIIESYFTPERMNVFEPVCRQRTETLVNQQPRSEPFELMGSLAQPLALQNQCAFMGWPDSLHKPLRRWVAANDPERNRTSNLLYGAGLHVCPGERLARLELRLVMESLLVNTTRSILDADSTTRRARFPASGY